MLFQCARKRRILIDALQGKRVKIQTICYRLEGLLITNDADTGSILVEILNDSQNLTPLTLTRATITPWSPAPLS